MIPTSFKNLFAGKTDAQATGETQLDASAASGISTGFEKAAGTETETAPVAVEETIEQERETELDGFVDPDALPAGTALHDGAFKIDRVLGHGGLSITYLSHSVASGQKVVIKEFFPPGAQRAPATVGPDGVAEYNVLAGGYCTGENYQQACTAFLEKARSVSRVWHPNVVMIYDTFAENNTAYMVMKFLKGNTLQELLEKRNVLEGEAVAYAMHIGQGLEALHKVDLIHGDIHPGNVMVCRQSQATPVLQDSAIPAPQAPTGERVLAGQRVFLIDCGLNRLPSVSTRPVSARPSNAGSGNARSGSARLQTRALREPQPIGAAGYAPLEQYGSNRPVGPQTDVYALGATLYHLLTGQVPVEALDRAQGERLPDPYSLNPRVSRALSDAVMWALAIQSADRPPTVRAFLERLSHCAGEAAPATGAQSTVPLRGQPATEKFSSASREAALQPRRAKPVSGGKGWLGQSNQMKQRFGLAALLSTTIGLAAWGLWRGSIMPPQPSQESAQSTAQSVSNTQRTVAVPSGLNNPELNNKAAKDNRGNNRPAGQRIQPETVQVDTPQAGTPQAGTPQIDAPQIDTSQRVRGNAATSVPAAPETRSVEADGDSTPKVDSGTPKNLGAPQRGTIIRPATEPESRVEPNRAGTRPLDAKQVEAGREERMPIPVRKSPMQKNQVTRTRDQTSSNTLRSRQTSEARSSLRASRVQSLPRRSAQQQQVAEEPRREPRVTLHSVPRRTLARRALLRRNVSRRVTEKPTSEADLPQLPDTIPQDRIRQGTTSEADLPPG
jgi:serine/threonine protein kinase